MADQNALLRPGDMRVSVVLHQAVLAGQQPTLEVQVEGIDSPFDGIRLLRAAEDQMRNDAERAVQQIVAQTQGAKVARER